MMEGYETFDKLEIIGCRKSLQLPFGVKNCVVGNYNLYNYWSFNAVSLSCLFYDKISLSLFFCS